MTTWRNSVSQAGRNRVSSRFLDNPVLLTGLAVLVVVVISIPLLSALEPSGRRLVINGAVLIVLSVSWNLMGGYVKLMSFGQAAFFGIGAYSAGMVLQALPNWPVALVTGATGGAVVATLMIPAFRVRGIYFAIFTLAFASGLLEIASKVFPGRESGLFVPGNTLLPRDEPTSAVLAVGLIGVSVFISVLLLQGRSGERLIAVREDADVARSLGINPTNVRASVVLVSGALAGSAGALFALTSPLINPSTVFSVDRSIMPVLATILGGAGTVLGPVLGGALWFILDETVRRGTTDASLSLLVHGGALLVLAVALPTGVVGRVRTWAQRAKLRKPIAEREERDGSDDERKVP